MKKRQKVNQSLTVPGLCYGLVRKVFGNSEDYLSAKNPCVGNYPSIQSKNIIPVSMLFGHESAKGTVYNVRLKREYLWEDTLV